MKNVIYKQLNPPSKEKVVFEMMELRRVPIRNTEEKYYPRDHRLLVLMILLIGGISLTILLTSRNLRYESLSVTSWIQTSHADSPLLYPFSIVFPIGNGTTMVCGTKRIKKVGLRCPGHSIRDGNFSVFCFLCPDEETDLRTSKSLMYRFALPQGNLTAFWEPR